MRHKNHALMEQIRDHVEDYYLAEGRFPSTTEIAAKVGLSRGTAYKYLVEMDKLGMITYDGSTIWTERLVKLREAQSVPLYTGAIPCGSPETVEAAVEDYVPLPVSIFGSDEMYVIRTSGNSMTEAGIDDGDLVVVKKQEHADVGDIVVAMHDNENTLKTLGCDPETKKYFLHPENSSMSDIAVDQLVIQGVAKFVIKTL